MLWYWQAFVIQSRKIYFDTHNRNSLNNIQYWWYTCNKYVYYSSLSFFISLNILLLLGEDLLLNFPLIPIQCIHFSVTILFPILYIIMLSVLASWFQNAAGKRRVEGLGGTIFFIFREVYFGPLLEWSFSRKLRALCEKHTLFYIQARSNRTRVL